MTEDSNRPLTKEDFEALAAFRHALRCFQAYSEERAADVGLTPRQHQALLAIRAASPEETSVGYVAERLILKPHSATGLIDRLEGLGLIVRHSVPADRRRTLLRLTPKAVEVLEQLSEVHRQEIQRIRPLLSALLESI